MSKIYEIDKADLGNKILSTYGDTLPELLDNAVYLCGEGLDEEIAACDEEATEYIKDWYKYNKCPEAEPRYQPDPMSLASDFEIGQIIDEGWDDL